MHPVLEKWYKLHKKYLYLEIKPYDFRTSELAKHLGVTRRTIERWVIGIGRPSKTHIEAIDRFLSDRSQE
jgi:transcriptional regulator with XRE-family HTH domain